NWRRNLPALRGGAGGAAATGAPLPECRGLPQSFCAPVARLARGAAGWTADGTRGVADARRARGAAGAVGRDTGCPRALAPERRNRCRRRPGRAPACALRWRLLPGAPADG